MLYFKKQFCAKLALLLCLCMLFSFTGVGQLLVDDAGVVNVSASTGSSGSSGSYSHSFSYWASGNILGAKCRASGHSDAPSLTIAAASKIECGDSSQIAMVEDTQYKWRDFFDTFPTISYVGRGGTVLDETEDFPDSIGKYTAKIEAGGAEVAIDFETITVPEGEFNTYSVLSKSLEGYIKVDNNKDGTVTVHMPTLAFDNKASYGGIEYTFHYGYEFANVSDPKARINMVNPKWDKHTAFSNEEETIDITINGANKNANTHLHLIVVGHPSNGSCQAPDSEKFIGYYCYTNPVKITYDLNGGKISGSTGNEVEEYLTNGEDLHDAPERPGYTFDGWYTEKDAGTEVTKCNGTVATYYAHWKVHEHNWIYSATGNKLEAYCSNAGCLSGTSVTHKVSLTLTAGDKDYSGNPVTATLTDPENKWQDNVNETLPTLIYYTNADCSEAHKTTVGVAGDSTSGAATVGGEPKNIGNYWAAITVGTGESAKTAKVAFSITSPGGGSGSGGSSPTPPPTPAPTEQYTIPVKGDDTVQIGAAITEGNAVVSEITTESLDKALNDNTQSGDKVTTKVTIDLSGATQEVTGVTLTKTSVDTLVKTVEDTGNQVEKVEIKLSNVVVVMDSKALEAISEQAEGDNIHLVVDDTEQNKLAAPQKEALKTYKVATTFEAYIECNGSRIHDFKGGSVTVNVGFKAEVGREQKFYHVFYVADDGKMTQYKTRFLDGMMQFTTTHFSDYAIIYDETQENETGKEPEQETTEPAKLDKTIAMNAGLKVSQTGKGINVKWGKVAGADGYFVYASYCGQPIKKIKTIQSVDTLTYKITKLDGQPLNLKKNYKICVVAYKGKEGKKVTLAKSIVAYVVGQKNTKNTNAKGIKLAKSKYTLAVGKTASIKATTILVDPVKAQLSDEHTKEFRYASSDKSIATVSKAGKLKAKKAGKCTIYVYARNGYAKRITVIVK